MKKTSQVDPKERPAAPQYGFRKLRPIKIPKAAWYALGLSLVMAVTLFVLYLVSFSGVKDAGNTLLIYSDGSNIPEVSLRNSLAAADFNFEIVEPDKRSSRQGYTYELPDGYNKGKVVVCAVGSDAFKVMNDLLSNGYGNIEGCILVDPEYPGNASLEGYTGEYPALPCAIFGSDTKAKSSSELGGSQMIFEKLSGVDTMYGHSTQRGKIFPSKVFVSQNRMRYLSLSSSFFINGRFSSPAFQNELAQYLGTTFGRGYSSSRIAVWTVILVFAMFMSIASFAVFLFMIPVSVPDKGDKILKGRDSLGAIIFLGISGWTALCGAVMTFIPQTRFLTGYVALYAPVAIIAMMAVAQIKIISSKKITYTRKDYGFSIFIASVLAGVIEIMILVALGLNLTNVGNKIKESSNWIAALLVFVIMSLSAVALILADKKSRISGQGPAAYFGSPLYFLEALLPSAVLLVLGAINSDSGLIISSLAGLGIGILPFACVTPIKRISDFYEIEGFIFGIISALILLIAG